MKFKNNNKPYVVITGGSGLLSLNWAQYIKNEYNVILLQHIRFINLENAFSIKCDLESYIDLYIILQKYNPMYFIHTAGLTNVEICENNSDLAKKVNVNITENVAKITNDLKIKLVHISTDHLFDGTFSNATEDDSTSPLNVYAITKLESEKVVAKYNNNSLIIRTNFFSWGPSYRNSFSDFIINNLKSNLSINLFQDVKYTPVHIYNLMKTTHYLLDHNQYGIFNISSDDIVTKFEFGKLIANIFNLNLDLIKPAFLSNNLELVKRPHDMSLSNKKASAFYKIGSVYEQILLLKKEEFYENINEIKNL